MSAQPDLMTEQHKTDRIEHYQAKQVELFQVNERVECYFVEENKEEESLRCVPLQDR